jgi:hypothetical protein
VINQQNPQLDITAGLTCSHARYFKVLDRSINKVVYGIVIVVGIASITTSAPLGIALVLLGAKGFHNQLAIDFTKAIQEKGADMMRNCEVFKDQSRRFQILEVSAIPIQVNIKRLDNGTLNISAMVGNDTQLVLATPVYVENESVYLGPIQINVTANATIGPDITPSVFNKKTAGWESWMTGLVAGVGGGAAALTATGFTIWKCYYSRHKSMESQSVS